MQNSLKTKLVIGTIIVLAGLSYLYFSKGKRTNKKTVNVTKKTSVVRDIVSKGKKINAKEAYKVALPYAKKWSSDAYLVEVTNFIGTKEADGKSKTWEVRFYSPSKDQDYVISVRGGEVRGGNERAHMSLNKIVDNWVDSDVAMETANKGLICKK